MRENWEPQRATIAERFAWLFMVIATVAGLCILVAVLVGMCFRIILYIGGA